MTCAECPGSFEAMFEFKLKCLVSENDFMQWFQAKSNMDIKNLDLKDASSHCSDIEITEAFVEDVVVKEEAVENFEDEALETSFEYVAVKEEAESSAVVVKREVDDDSAESGEVVQPETKGFECPFCSKRFKWQSKMKAHMVCHSEGRQHDCERCGKKLKTKKTLKNHMKVHEEVLNYACEYCERRFVDRYRLNKHLLSHTKPYHCEICDRRFGQKTYFTLHMDRHAGNQYDCTVCGKSFNSENLLTVHKCVGFLKRPHQCDKCSKKYTTLSNLTIHQKTHSVKNFKCEFCNKLCHRKLSVILHIKRVHKDVDLDTVVVKPINPSFDDDVKKVKKERKKKLHNCAVCKWGFSTKRNLRVHKCRGFKERPYQCEKCQKKFVERRNLIKHQIMHSAVKNFKCEFCEKPFYSEDATKLHIVNKHKDVDINTVVIEPLNTGVDDEVEKESKKIKVEDFAAVDESITVVKHEVDDYSSESVEVLRPENTVLDLKVEPSADESITVVKHEVEDCSSDSKSHRCEICDRRFTRKSNLNVHLRTHNGERPHRCTVCGKGFYRGRTLKSHMRSHTGEKPYACESCDRRFTQKACLTVHRRTHTGKRPYVCTVCDKAFHTKYILQEHARMHSKERPYQCDLCQKRFPRLGSLVEHRKRHFGIKNFECEFCKRPFYMKSALEQHIVKMHKDVDINTVVIKPFKDQNDDIL